MLTTTGVPRVTAVQAVEAGGTLVLASEIAEIVIAVAMLVLVGLAIVLFLRVNALLKDVRGAATQHFGPVSDRARSISDNVEFVTQALRTDVERLNASVRALSDRLQLASTRMEERIEEFNALMEVVQGEAEEVFLDTASTVRGVREGARAIADRGKSAEPNEPGSAARVSSDALSETPAALDPSGEGRPLDSQSEENAPALRED